MGHMFRKGVYLYQVMFNMAFKILTIMWENPSYVACLENRIWWVSEENGMIEWSVSWNSTHSRYHIQSFQT